MNMNNENIRKAVREEIRHHPVLTSSLKHFAEHDAVFYPGYGNLGDALIAVGTLDLFDDIGWAPKHVYGRHKHVLSGHNHVVMGGGGGWVKGLWESYTEQTVEFLQNGGQLLILPSSFSGFGECLLPYADQVTIFCREQQSYDALIQQGMPEDRVFLCPDLAFYTKEKHFSDLEVAGHYPVLKIFRRDEEGISRPSPRDSVDLPLLFNDVQWATFDECLPPLRAAASLISQFECVETDRLHMAILSTLLGRIVKIKPSNYFKIKAVFDYTLHRFPTASFEESAHGYSCEEQNDDAYVRKLREEIKHLKREQQAEWERRTIALRQNDALLSRLEAVQEELGEASKKADILLEEKQAETRQKQAETRQKKDLMQQVGVLQNELKRKDDNFDQICLELAQLHEKKNGEFERLKQELETIRSSRLHRLGERYYTIFRLPGVGALLRGVRKIMTG